MFETLIGLAGTIFFGVFGWTIQKTIKQQADIVELQTQRDDLRVLINTRFDEVNRRLSRIEVAMNGVLGHE